MYKTIIDPFETRILSTNCPTSQRPPGPHLRGLMAVRFWLIPWSHWRLSGCCVPASVAIPWIRTLGECKVWPWLADICFAFSLWSYHVIYNLQGNIDVQVWFSLMSSYVAPRPQNNKTRLYYTRRTGHENPYLLHCFFFGRSLNFWAAAWPSGPLGWRMLKRKTSRPRNILWW